MTSVEKSSASSSESVPLNQSTGRSDRNFHTRISLKPALEKVKQLGLKKDGKKQNLILRNKSWNFRQGGFKDPLKFSLDAIVLVDSDKCDEYKDYEYKDYKGYH